MLRTQIYLPEDLRQDIDRITKDSNQSLAEYARNAIEKEVKKDKKRKVDLAKLASDFIGCSTRTDAEVQEWLDWVREERRLSDEVREERLQRALKKK
ncbi:hypothetical protein HYZ05_02050 [Candidatus Daviesbacteria bacterium]|nr:hypothetical protein [Candidatus Daviesbacteria bacterium]